MPDFRLARVRADIGHEIHIAAQDRIDRLVFCLCGIRMTCYIDSPLTGRVCAECVASCASITVTMLGVQMAPQVADETECERVARVDTER